MSDLIPAEEGYGSFLEEIKTRVREARVRAAAAVHQELVLLYWHVGHGILRRQEQLGWGAKVIDQLARDLTRAFPEMKGFSPRNLKYMRAFAQAWPDPVFVQEVLARMPWYHQIALLEKLDSPREREFYARAAIEHGWSRNVLVVQIERGLVHRHGKAQTNFERTLPVPDSDLARESLKDPYVFDFLGLADDVQERELELALVHHVRELLLELGIGFAFVGNQVHLEVAGQDYYLDLLFYHLKLRCYVVVELKAGEFRPEHAGKLNFYLSAVDDHVRGAGDGPSIGLLLCKGRNRVIVEYALRNTTTPIGVAAWQLTRALPAELSTELPTVELLESELRGETSRE